MSQNNGISQKKKKHSKITLTGIKHIWNVKSIVEINMPFREFFISPNKQKKKEKKKKLKPSTIV